MDYFGKKLLIKDNHLYWENGELFFYLADTLWYGLTNRCTDDEFETILKDRKQKGFTAIQLVVGVPPESEVFDKNAQSTNGHFAFTETYDINKEYFEDIKRKVEMVVRYELVPVLFGSWGHYIDIVGVNGMKKLWSKIVEYFGEYPVMYSLCGEVDIIQNNIKTPFTQKVVSKLPLIKKMGKVLQRLSYDSLIKERIEKWQQVANHLVSINNELHPVTVHIQSTKLASEVFQNNSFITIDSFQSGHSLNGIEIMNNHFSKLKKLDRPMINLEPLYEGILDQFDTRLQNISFYTSMFSGAAGHSYGAHGLWQMSKGDDFMQHWGKSQWNEALQYPGSTSVGKAKQFIQEFDWNNVENVTDKITIDYSDNPQIKHTAGRYKNVVLLYIPYPQNIASLKLNYEFQKFITYGPNSFAMIKEGLDISEIYSIGKTHIELIIAFYIV